jgi:hypothetical protein
MVAVTPVRLTSRMGVFFANGPICPQPGRDELLLIRRSGPTPGFAETLITHTPTRPFAHSLP